MKKKNLFMPVLLCSVMMLAACGKEEKTDAASLFESVATETAATQETTETESAQEVTEQTAGEQEVADQEPSADSNAETISEEQAYNAVINYCKANNPDFSAEPNSEGYTEYWDASTNENGEIVVLYRSYTAAQTRYYVNPVSGETRVTELVPGIIDEEQETGETFNARDYLNK